MSELHNLFPGEARVVRLIAVGMLRGRGTQKDPGRTTLVLREEDGTFVAQLDPHLDPLHCRATGEPLDREGPRHDEDQ